MASWALRQRYGFAADGSPRPNHRVCYQKLAIGIYGPAAPMTVASWDTPCSRTALIRAYSDVVIRGLGLQSRTHYAEKEPSRTVRVTYMARRASTEWPEKRYCNDTHSFFLCRFWEGPNALGVRSLGRMVQNDASVVEKLKALEGRTFSNGALVKVTDVDYNLLSFEEQIETDLQTDIMVFPVHH